MRRITLWGLALLTGLLIEGGVSALGRGHPSSPQARASILR
jgi:hypothetical protein